MGEIKIPGIVGSQRKHSYNRFALKAAQELVPEGAALELVELHGIPFFGQNRALVPPLTVMEFKQRIVGADAILFATPDCNHSVTGALKNAIDWAGCPTGESVWLSKPAAVSQGGRMKKEETPRRKFALRVISEIGYPSWAPIRRSAIDLRPGSSATGSDPASAPDAAATINYETGS